MASHDLGGAAFFRLLAILEIGWGTHTADSASLAESTAKLFILVPILLVVGLQSKKQLVTHLVDAFKVIQLLLALL